MSFREQLSELEVTVSSPSEKVSLTAVGIASVRVSFAPGYYQRASTDDIETQLARAARLLFVERTRAMYDGLSNEAGSPVRPGLDRSRPRARAYGEGLDGLAAKGASADGDVTVTSVGLGNFAVRIAAGVLDRLDEGEFGAACAAAAQAYLAEQQAKVAQLKYDVYLKDAIETLRTTHGR